MPGVMATASRQAATWRGVAGEVFAFFKLRAREESGGCRAATLRANPHPPAGTLSQRGMNSRVEREARFGCALRAAPGANARVVAKSAPHSFGRGVGRGYGST